MNSAFMLALSFFMGALLGVFYFGGLWLTIKRLPHSSQPTLLSLASFSARSLVCILGFYLIIGSGIEALLLSLAGFVLTKMALIHKLSLGCKNGGALKWSR
ncbi:MAG: ATP synthase subunit I [Methanotrichaceae archaeon]|nr:ATP synthase subunit I [Methanotrichaceae archaeon]